MTMVHLVLGLLAGALSVFLHGLTLSIMWRWFMVPSLGLSQISIVQAVGISLVVGCLTHQLTDCEPRNEEEKEKKFYRNLSLSVARPLVFLFMGWIVHLFM